MAEVASRGQAAVAAVVLAAGGSTRMGRCKAILPLRGSTYLEVALDTLQQCSLQPLLVVLGDRAGEVLEHARLGKAVALLNRRWQDGMLSSLQLAVQHLLQEHRGVEALLVALVDAPLFEPGTVSALLAAYRRTAAPVVLPSFNGEHGHPVLFSRDIWGELLEAPPGEGARAVVEAHRHDLLEVPVPDGWVLRDADTPPEHEALLRDDSRGPQAESEA